MTVSLVIVSHSAKVAEGVVDLAAQMAAGVPILAAGGTDEGGIGTSFDRIQTSIERGLDASTTGESGVVVLCDLGSAILTAETVLEFLNEDAASRVRLADAPLVEGAIAAAVESAGGAPLARVAEIAESAWGRGDAAAAGTSGEAEAAGAASASAGDGDGDGDEVVEHLEVLSPHGMHARPAAHLVQLVNRHDAVVTIAGADGRSLLKLMSLGLRQGDPVEVRTSGPDRRLVADEIAAYFRDGFGELDATA